MKKNCGNCGWWGKLGRLAVHGKCGWDEYPLPAWVDTYHEETRWTAKSDGADCPCHKHKAETQENPNDQ